MNQYIGHASQVCGIEEHRLVGGKGDGMRLLEVNNGKGLMMTLLPDRAADIGRLRFKGINLGYMSPCGYVAPAYYDSIGANFLRSFTAGFMTTCGLQSVGTPCTDDGVEYPLHGSIGHTPCDRVNWYETEEGFVVEAQVSDEIIFDRKLVLNRKYMISTNENVFCFQDRIENRGDRREGFEVLYHMNMGYPLLDENSVITIPSEKVVPRNEHAAEDIENWMHMEKPVQGYEERCYYHYFPDENGKASIWQPSLGVGLEITYDTRRLDGFVEWKMMGVRDYVLGLECGNCTADGRAAMRESGMLKYLEPGESITYEVKIRLLEA